METTQSISRSSKAGIFNPLSPSDSTIFVVDDDASLRRSLARIILSGGWNVETFSSASEFLQHSFADSGRGCVLLDVQMPEMSGPELHDQMEISGISLPVVFLTAHGDMATCVRQMKKERPIFLKNPSKIFRYS